MSAQDKFIDWIKQHFEYFRKGQTKFRNKVYYTTDYSKFFSSNLELFGEDLVYVLTDLSDLERKQAFAKGIQAVLDLNTPDKKSDALSDLPRNGFLKEIMENCTLVNVLNHRSKTGENVFFDKRTQRVSPITVESVKNVLTHKEWNEYRVSAESRYAHYKPHELISTPEYVNLHLPPEWRSVSKPESVLPEMYKEYFEFLFPDEKSREVAYRWVLRSIDSRCQQYLILCGKEGSGKSIFAEVLLKSLHGEHNYFKAKENFMTSDFSGYMEDKTVLFVDEVQVAGRGQLDILKDRINDFITVEAKGVDQRYVQNHTSFVLSTNFTNAIYINPISGRRFSVPELTDQKLEKVKGEKWIDALVADLKDAELNAKFVTWLRNRYNAHDSRWEVMHGPTYEKICKDSCSEGIKFLLEKLESREQQRYNIKQLRTEMTGTYGRANRYNAIPSVGYLEQFFNAFTVDGKLIARVEGPYIVPINDYEVKSDVE